MLPRAVSPRPVECVNCSDDTAAIILAGAAFMVGLFSLFIAARQYAMMSASMPSSTEGSRRDLA
jgi:hypothetical protein